MYSKSLITKPAMIFITKEEFDHKEGNERVQAFEEPFDCFKRTMDHCNVWVLTREEPAIKMRKIILPFYYGVAVESLMELV